MPASKMDQCRARGLQIIGTADDWGRGRASMHRGTTGRANKKEVRASMASVTPPPVMRVSVLHNGCTCEESLESPCGLSAVDEQRVMTR